MALVSPKKLFEKAMIGKYAVGAFNAYNMETIQSIISVAQKTKSPVIIQFSPSALKYAGGVWVKHLINATAEISKIDFAVHLDHGEDYEICKQAIDLGFTSVMIDGSKLSLDENIKLTKKVVKYAHTKNVWVEAEIGRISGVEDNISVSKKESLFTD